MKKSDDLRQKSSDCEGLGMSLGTVKPEASAGHFIASALFALAAELAAIREQIDEERKR